MVVSENAILIPPYPSQHLPVSHHTTLPYDVQSFFIPIHYCLSEAIARWWKDIMASCYVGCSTTECLEIFKSKLQILYANGQRIETKDASLVIFGKGRAE